MLAKILGRALGERNSMLCALTYQSYYVNIVAPSYSVISLISINHAIMVHMFFIAISKKMSSSYIHATPHRLHIKF